MGQAARGPPPLEVRLGRAQNRRNHAGGGSEQISDRRCASGPMRQWEVVALRDRGLCESARKFGMVASTKQLARPAAHRDRRLFDRNPLAFELA
jgi:hypothetical protein